MDTENKRKKKRERSPRHIRRRLRAEGQLKSACARLQFLRTTPRKARLVVDQIRGKSVQEALQILEFSQRVVSVSLHRLLKSALANAQEAGLNLDALFVSDAQVNGGPIMKRFMPRAMGRASRIKKYTSHVTLVLKEK